ncbi:MAG: hypothetical protein KAX44_09365 [Candidatus Brocadiae bacterium]|nr:hypothetical protein [Candidatus Brocadiia bacterium]
MPTFTDKAKRLDRIRLALKGRYGEQPKPIITHPVEYVLRTILGEEATRKQVEEALERMRAHFVDWNDLRVSRPREIRETLGAGFPSAVHKARVIPRLLDQVFKRHNSMVWDFLEGRGKVATRAYFEGLEEVRPFVAAAMARDCVGAHTFPVDRDVARVLGRLDILDPENQSESRMQAFLERAVKNTRVYETHQLVKRLGEDRCIVGTPLCRRCPLNNTCPSAAITAKKAKRKKPKRAPKKKTRKRKVARKRTASRRKARKEKIKRTARKKK